MSSKTINERVNTRAAKYLSTISLEEFKAIKLKYSKKSQTAKGLKSEYEVLKQFCKSTLKSGGRVDRIYTSKFTDRLYCAESIQGISKSFKGLLLNGLTSDIDIKNCHPKLLESICKSNGILVPMLEYYNKNRDQVLVENPDAKTEIIEYINGSKKKPTSSFMKKFKEECGSEIHDKLVKLEKFKQLRDFHKTGENKNPAGALAFRIMEQLEVEIIHKVVIPYLESKGLEIAVVMHDGAHVYGDLYSNKELLRVLEAKIEDKYPGLGLEFAYKEHDTRVEIPGDFEEGGEENDAGSYENVKKEFEKTHFKVCEKGLFGKETEDEVLFYSPHGLTASYEHMVCFARGFNKDGEPIKIKKQFIGLWRMDPEIRIYRSIGCYPDSNKCPKDDFNTWTPFAMERVKEFVRKETELKEFLDHIMILCDHDEATFTYLCKWIGQMFARPEVKTICPTFISDEGAGKGTLIELLRRMMGAKKVFESTNPSRDVWGSFNGRMANCFLVVLSEISKKDSAESEGRIKGLITDSALTINNKGVDSYEIESYHRFMSATNAEQFMTIKHGSRRHCVVRSSDEKIGDKDYFTHLRELLDDVNVVKTCFEYFKNLEGLDKFGSLPLPISEHQKILQDSAVSPVELWIKKIVGETNEGTVEMSAADSYTSFCNFLITNGFKNYEVNSLQFATRLGLLKIDGVGSGPRKNNQRSRIFDVAKVRAHFKMGGECMF
ncbi:hypothetical protein BASA81_002071 [Batrachochytrium salamandrivorans]|nr:hypothetical protein BASA81_002071 [Batrachochytrium salamandrivorans]